LRKTRIKSKTLTASDHGSKRGGSIKNKKGKKKEELNNASYDKYSEEIEDLPKDEEFMMDLEDKVLEDISSDEVEMKDKQPKEESSEQEGKQFTPDEEFRLLQVYFKEMGMEPLLTPKEEI